MADRHYALARAGLLFCQSKHIAFLSSSLTSRRRCLSSLIWTHGCYEEDKKGLKEELFAETRWSGFPYRPVRPLMVFRAITVVGAIPPKLKLQSLICHEEELPCFSNSTLIPVLTIAMSSSRRRACLKA